MSILDNVKQQMQSPLQKPTNLGGQTESIRSLLRAKSGKSSVPDSGPKQSSIQEKMAEQQTAQAGQQLQQQGQLAAAQLGEQEADIQQRMDIQQSLYLDAMKSQQADFDNRSRSILNDFKMGQKRLSNSRDLAQIEQLGVDARLSNDKYIHQLETEGARARLEDEKNFQMEFAKQQLADQMDMFRNQQEFEAWANMDERQYQTEIQQMDINKAIEIAEKQIEASNKRRMAKGAGQLAQGAWDYYGGNEKLMGIFKSSGGEPITAEALNATQDASQAGPSYTNPNLGMA